MNTIYWRGYTFVVVVLQGDLTFRKEYGYCYRSPPSMYTVLCLGIDGSNQPTNQPLQELCRRNASNATRLLRYPHIMMCMIQKRIVVGS